MGYGNGRGSKVFGVEGASPQSPLSSHRLSRHSSFTEPWSSGSSREARSLLKHMSSLGGSRLSRVSEPEVGLSAGFRVEGRTEGEGVAGGGEVKPWNHNRVECKE
jgi:hypothetical protein